MVSPVDNEGWSRSAWVVFAGIATLVGLLNLWRWTQGFDHWEVLLPPAVPLVVALAHVFQLRGLAKRVSQVVCWLMLIIVAVMLIIR
jgi:hypothetical protein